MKDTYLEEFQKLNEYQKQAVVSRDKYALLNAVVGSGKTTVLVHKVLYLHLIYNVPIEDMMVLTFTNKAAGEIKDRVSVFGRELQNSMKYFGTFHSVARTILMDSKKLEGMGYTKDFTVIDNIEAGDMLLKILNRDNLKIKYKARLMKRLDEFKKGKTLYGVMKNEDDIETLYKLYNEEKLKNNLMDFDDLIENCIKVLDVPLNPSWIIIDEFQDTDIRQFELIKRIAGRNTHIFAIGDPNQIIYSFRTGTNKIFDEYKKTFSPREFALPLNYRSSRTIIEAARVFLGGGHIEGVKEYGNPILIKRHHDAFNEALHISRRIIEFNNDGISYKDIAVLYRRTAQSEVLTDVFEREGIPYRVVFKKEIAFENLDEENCDNDRVNLLTLHASKGLEFSHVFIIGANMGNMPITSKRGEEEEEARLFFVGITRAKNYLEISYLTKPNMQGAAPYPSPYISMIPSGLIIKEDDGSGITLKELVRELREEREKKKSEDKTKRAVHPKYGEGVVVYEDENIVKVEFNGYGQKEFSKLFCPLEFK